MASTNTFMMYLPRLCEHCLNPTCVASCPSEVIYKQEEDGVSSTRTSAAAGACASPVPYKKIYFNWKSMASRKCIFLLPADRSGHAHGLLETCVGRIRYLGVLLYDADRILEAAAAPRAGPVPQSTGVFLDPNDPRGDYPGAPRRVPDSVIESAQRSPCTSWRWTGSWHCRCIRVSHPMVWYVPCPHPGRGRCRAHRDERRHPGCRCPRIPIPLSRQHAHCRRRGPGALALKRLLAMRAYRRGRHVEGVEDTAVLEEGSHRRPGHGDVYRYLAIANYEDRFVVPTAHRERRGKAPRRKRTAAGFLSVTAAVTAIRR